MKANRASRSRRAWADDDAGAFPVVEAILVVILVLTAILFFTSVQRPTTGSEAGGIDLGQVSSDTLRIIQLREFDATATTGAPYPGGSDLSLEEWVTNLAAGDGPSGAGRTATAVDEFLDEVLPTGARYSLRLSNGVGSMQILPQGATETPQGATASEVLFLPDWDAYQGQPVTTVVTPGQLLDSSHAAYAWTNPSGAIQCVKSPLGNSTRPDGSDSGSAGDSWITTWRARLGQVPAPTDGYGQVPSDAPFGTWAGYTNAGCTTSPQYLKVVRDTSALRVVTGATTYAGPIPSKVTITAPSGSFDATTDPGKSIQVIKSDGTALVASGTTISTVTGTTTITVSGTGPSQALIGSVTLVIGVDNPHSPYGLQLVVWFGA